MTRQFHLTEYEPSEKSLQQTVRVALNKVLRPPAVWFAMPVGHIELTAAQAATLASIGTQAGLPDLFVVYGRTHGIELKVKGRGLSKTRVVRTRSGAQRIVEGQEDTFPKLEAAGMPIAVCRSLDDVIDALVEWKIPMISCRVAA